MLAQTMLQVVELTPSPAEGLFQEENPPAGPGLTLFKACEGTTAAVKLHVSNVGKIHNLSLHTDLELD